jgi:hypothetical protein
MSWGMISWELPLERYPHTYNGQPLAYAALAAQKSHTALYLNCIYASDERTERLRKPMPRPARSSTWARAASASKSRGCAEDVLGQAIASVPVEEFIAEYERSRAG